jgi:hypothetical protein
MGFEPLIGKLMDGGDGDPCAREAANRIVFFIRSFGGTEGYCFFFKKKIIKKCKKNYFYINI